METQPRDEQTKNAEESEIQIESEKKNLITAQWRLAELGFRGALEARESSEKTVHTLNLIFGHFFLQLIEPANDQLM